jgi:hypothetical protein
MQFWMWSQLDNAINPDSYLCSTRDIRLFHEAVSTVVTIAL